MAPSLLHSVAVTTKGEVFKWIFDRGSLGHGIDDHTVKPKQIKCDLGKAVAYACGNKHSSMVAWECLFVCGLIPRKGALMEGGGLLALNYFKQLCDSTKLYVCGHGDLKTPNCSILGELGVPF